MHRLVAEDALDSDRLAARRSFRDPEAIGDTAPRWIAERIGALALAGDFEGVERFRAIAARVSELLASSRQ